MYEVLSLQALLNMWVLGMKRFELSEIIVGENLVLGLKRFVISLGQYMIRAVSLFSILLLCACVSFDKTNIQPGQRVVGLGFSFTVPTQKSWFAVEYGTSHRIKLSQLNDQDSYSILVSLNRGPRKGMYQSAEAHLKAVQRHKRGKIRSAGLIRLHHHEWVDARYGKLCVRYVSSDEDWRGRNSKGPAMVDTVGLICEHPEIENVLLSIEISKRFEVNATASGLDSYADVLFSSVAYNNIN